MASHDRSRSPPRRSTSTLKPEKEQHHRKWLSTVVIDPDGPHTSTLLFLHGFMGDARGYADADEGVYWTGDGGLKVILVNAPQRRVTCSREVTNAWYDYLTDREGEFCDVIDRAQFDDVVYAVHRLMQKEFDIVGPGNVSIGGYSQGGTIALHAGMTWQGSRLGGIYAISTTLLTTTPAVDPGCKIRAFHGLADEVFPWDKWAREGWARLLASGADLELHVQPDVCHVEDEWEAALIRKCFRSNCPEESALKLQRVALSSAEIESAGSLETALRASRAATLLMHRFEYFLVSDWRCIKEANKQSQMDLREHMKSWQANNWAQKSICKRAGGDARFDLVVCEVQGGPESACRPLPVAEASEQLLTSGGAAVLSLGVIRSGFSSYLTRTFLCEPSAQLRIIYRSVCSLLDSVTQHLCLGMTVQELRKTCKDLADSQFREASKQVKNIQKGKFEVYVNALGRGAPGGLAELEDAGSIGEGAHVVTVGFAIAAGGPSRVANKQAPLEPVWLQDTVWVQQHSGGVTLMLTQNASKEETCVMYKAAENAQPQDDLDIAVRALSDIRAVLHAQKRRSALSKEVAGVLDSPDIDELLNRAQEEAEENADEGEEAEEEDE